MLELAKTRKPADRLTVDRNHLHREAKPLDVGLAADPGWSSDSTTADGEPDSDQRSVARVGSASIFHSSLRLLFGAIVEVMPGVEFGKEQHFANGQLAQQWMR
jgi:hypothetical protein